MATQSRSVIAALDGIRDQITSARSGLKYPSIANGPVEEVLAFNNDEEIVLITGNTPHFSSRGGLRDLQNRESLGTVLTSFPINPNQYEELFKWPPEQEKPFDQAPPLDSTNTTGNGYSKQAYFFDDNSSLVTVGPSLPKIARLQGGGAQFWVGSIGVITQGTGKYQGARGMSVYLGSAYFEKFPTTPEKVFQLLHTPFKARVSTYFKVVYKSVVAP